MKLYYSSIDRLGMCGQRYDEEVKIIRCSMIYKKNVYFILYFQGCNIIIARIAFNEFSIIIIFFSSQTTDQAMKIFLWRRELIKSVM